MTTQSEPRSPDSAPVPQETQADSERERDWYSDTPARDTWVWMTYSLLQPWHLVKTCKRGCCVQDPFFGSMLLPNFWKPATAQDVAKIEQEIANFDASQQKEKIE
jgi:hypothetical protein